MVTAEATASWRPCQRLEARPGCLWPSSVDTTTEAENSDASWSGQIMRDILTLLQPPDLAQGLLPPRHDLLHPRHLGLELQVVQQLQPPHLQEPGEAGRRLRCLITWSRSSFWLALRPGGLLNSSQRPARGWGCRQTTQWRLEAASTLTMVSTCTFTWGQRVSSGYTRHQTLDTQY